MNRGNMHPFLYAMRLRGLKHGSEEEYDMFEEFAICRAKNRRMNGGADSRLQLSPAASGGGAGAGAGGDAVADTTRGDEHLAQEESSCAPADAKWCSQLEKDDNNTPPTTPAKDEAQAPGNAPHVCSLDAEEQSPQPDPSTSSNSAVLQITIQVRSAGKKNKCGERAICDESPLQATGGDELE